MEFSEKNIVNKIQNVAKWEFLGLQLGFSYDHLKIIKKDSSDTSEAIICLVGEWIRNDKKASWKTLAEALRLTGYNNLADSLHGEKFAGEVRRSSNIKIYAEWHSFINIM